MKAKKETIITWLLAGAMVLGGTGALTVSMSKAQEQEVYAQIEKMGLQETQMAAKEQVSEMTGTVKNGEKIKNSGKSASENSIWQAEDSIYLPESAVIEERAKQWYDITWKDYQIRYFQNYYQDEKDILEKEKKIDMGIARVIESIEKMIKQYSGEEISAAKIQFELRKNTVPEGRKNVDNTRNYGVRFYRLFIDGLKGHSFNIEINSVTGELLFYSHYITEDISDIEIGGKQDELQKRYAPIASKFIKEKLGLGDVEKVIQFNIGSMGMSRSGNRSTICFVYQTLNKDIINIWLDSLTKEVCYIAVNPLYYKL